MATGHFNRELECRPRVALALYLVWNPSVLRSSVAHCPSRPPSACEAASRTSRVVLWVSGHDLRGRLLAAYVVGLLLMRFG
jgi:hypothetical protein